ncbi:MAG: glycosyltransferase family 4 protein, partial [Rhodospirillales bacterium]|nr:glycosyltransferase family 4 protein [Rhodospirillales bacterium]
MNLLYALPFWPYFYTSYLFREVAWMRSRGHHVAVISLAPPPGPTADLKPLGLDDVPVLQLRRHYRDDGLLLRQVLGMGPTGLIAPVSRSLSASIRQAGVRQGLHEWSMLKRAVAFARRHRAQVVEAHWAAESAALAIELKRALDLPFAVRLHGGDLHTNPSPMLPLIVQEASALCPVSQFLADLLAGQRPVERLPLVPRIQLDPAKVRVCHNGLPDEVIAADPVPQNDDLCRVGTLGRLDPEKRHGDLLAAVAALVKEHPGIRLRIIGGGVLQPTLEQQARDLGVADRLEITGAIPWPDAMRRAREHHVYVQASQVEGCSLATLEGQAQGVPVVLSNTGAHSASVDPGVNGYLFESGDVRQLTEMLARIVAASPRQREDMGRHSLDLIRRRFRFTDLMPRVEAILQAVRDRTS